MKTNIRPFFLLVLFLQVFGVKAVKMWTTTGDQKSLLSPQDLKLFPDVDPQFPSVLLRPHTRMQGVEGFGFALTGGSAMLLQALPAAARASLLGSFFGPGTSGGISVSYLRVSIGASDLDPFVFSYDDGAAPDPSLSRFSIAQDEKYLIPTLKEILAIQPTLSLLGSPWSPPAWMKSNNGTMGGGLLDEYQAAYAQYFVKYVQAYAAHGITIGAITPQNEPLNPKNNPSMVMQAADEARFIRDHLGPALRAAGLGTKILVFDHNCDTPEYPLAVLADEAARAFVHGSAFHMYLGNASAMGLVHDRYPDKAVYFTEQWTGSMGTFSGDLMWHSRNIVIGTLNNWSQTVLEWNLASDPEFGPHTPGGCDACLGAVTIDPSKGSAKINVSYYIIAHASRFLPKGSVRIASTPLTSLPSVGFVTPAGDLVVLVLNDSAEDATINLGIEGGPKPVWLRPTLKSGSMNTIVWRQ